MKNIAATKTGTAQRIWMRVRKLLSHTRSSLPFRRTAS